MLDFTLEDANAVDAQRPPQAQPHSPEFTIADADAVDGRIPSPPEGAGMDASGREVLDRAGVPTQEDSTWIGRRLGDVKLAGKVVGQGLYSAAADVFPKTMAETWRGGDVPLRPEETATGRMIEEQQKDLERWNLPPEEANRELFGLVKGKDVQEGLQNLGYSAGSMAAGMGAGAVAGSVVPGAGTAGGAIAGALGAGLAGGTVGYRATKDQFIEQMRQKLLEADPSLSEEKWKEAKELIDKDASLYGLWEAVPEAVGDALTMGIIKTPVGKVIENVPFIKNGVARAAASAAVKLGLDLPVELGTETWTQHGQGDIEAKLGLREKAPGWSESFDEIAPQTTVMTLATMGLGHAAEHMMPANRAARRYVRTIAGEIKAGEHRNLSDEDLQTAYANTAALFKERPGIELRDALGELNAEILRRQEGEEVPQAVETPGESASPEAAFEPAGPDRAAELAKLSKRQLNDLAGGLGIGTPGRLKRDALVDSILQAEEASRKWNEPDNVEARYREAHAAPFPAGQDDFLSQAAPVAPEPATPEMPAPVPETPATPDRAAELADMAHSELRTLAASLGIEKPGRPRRDLVPAIVAAEEQARQFYGPDNIEARYQEGHAAPFPGQLDGFLDGAAPTGRRPRSRIVKPVETQRTPEVLPTGEVPLVEARREGVAVNERPENAPKPEAPLNESALSLTETASAAQPVEDLAAKSRRELNDLAASLGVERPGAVRREDLLGRIEQARQEAAQTQPEATTAGQGEAAQTAKVWSGDALKEVPVIEHEGVKTINVSGEGVPPVYAVLRNLPGSDEHQITQYSGKTPAEAVAASQRPAESPHPMNAATRGQALQALTAEQQNALGQELGLKAGRKSRMGFLEAIFDTPELKLREAYDAVVGAAGQSAVASKPERMAAGEAKGDVQGPVAMPSGEAGAVVEPLPAVEQSKSQKPRRLTREESALARMEVEVRQKHLRDLANKVTDVNGQPRDVRVTREGPDHVSVKAKDHNGNWVQLPNQNLFTGSKKDIERNKFWDNDLAREVFQTTHKDRFADIWPARYSDYTPDAVKRPTPAQMGLGKGAYPSWMAIEAGGRKGWSEGRMADFGEVPYKENPKDHLLDGNPEPRDFSRILDRVSSSDPKLTPLYVQHDSEGDKIIFAIEGEDRLVSAPLRDVSYFASKYGADGVTLHQRDTEQPIGVVKRGESDPVGLFMPMKQAPDRPLSDADIKRQIREDSGGKDNHPVSGSAQSEHPNAGIAPKEDARDEPVTEAMQPPATAHDETSGGEALGAPETAGAPGETSRPEIGMKFGEEIGGSRYDRAQSRLTISDLADMTEREREAYVVKNNVWPAMQYDKMIEDGVPRLVAYLVKKIRDAIPSAPQKLRGKTTAEAQEVYIRAVERARDVLSGVKTEEDLKGLFDKVFTAKEFDRARPSLERWSQDGREMATALGGNKFVRAVQVTSRDLSNAFRKMTSTDWPAKRTRNSANDETGRPQPYKRPLLESVERTGEDYRQGKDVTPEAFQEVFGFRGGEFGKWLSQGDRQESLNHAYDALMDLSGTLGVPPKALSLNGELGFAFGARGGGRFAAHYEPVKVVINLTKTQGAGALAHEWFHAMDDYFGRQSGDRGKARPYVSHGGLERWNPVTKQYESLSAMRPEMVKAWGDVISALERFEGKRTDFSAKAGGLGKYWARPHEKAARAFESYVQDQIEGGEKKSQYLVHGTEAEIPGVYPSGQEREAINAAFDNFFQTVKTKETDRGVLMFSRSEEPKTEAARLFETVEPVRLTGNEIADFAEPNDIRALRREAVAYATSDDFKREVTNTHDQSEIIITPRSIRSAFSHGAGPEKIQAVAALPEMLERAVPVGSRTVEAQHREKRHFYAAKFAIGDKEYVAGLVVREDANGRRFYDHELSKIESPEAVIVTAGRGLDERGTQSPTPRDSGNPGAVLPHQGAVSEESRGPRPSQDSVMDIVRKALGVNIDFRFKRAEGGEGTADRASMQQEGANRQTTTEEEQPLFKRGPGADVAASPVARAVAEMLRQGLSQVPALRGLVDVYHSETDLPADLRQDIEAAGVSGRFYGAYDPETKRIALVAGNIPTEKAGQAAFVQTLLRHEGRHGGLDLVLGGREARQEHMLQAARIMPKEVSRWLERNGLDSTRATRAEAAEEILVSWAKDGTVHRALDRLLGKVAEWVRTIFPSLKLTKPELRQLLAQADDFVDGKGPDFVTPLGQPFAAAPAFARGETRFARAGELAGVPEEKENVRGWYKDEVTATMRSVLPAVRGAVKETSALGKILRSPEYWQHPVLKRLYETFRDRTDHAHEILHKALDAGEGRTILDEAKTVLKDPKQREILNEGVDHADVNEIQPEAMEAWFKDHGATEGTIALWRTMRERYDMLLDERLASYHRLMDKARDTYGRKIVRRLIDAGIPAAEAKTFDAADYHADKTLSEDLAPYASEVADVVSKARKDGLTIKDQLTDVRLKGEDGASFSLKEMIERMGQMRGFYAPRLRETGDYVVRGERTGEDGQVERFRAHKEWRAGAEALRAKMERAGWDMEPVGRVEKLPEATQGIIKALELAKTVESAVNRVGEDVDAGLVQELLETLADEVKARGFRAQSIRRSGRHGDVVTGYFKDAMERFTRYAGQTAYGLAKMEAAGKAAKVLFGQDGGPGIDIRKERDVYRLAVDYLSENLRNPEAGDRVFSLAKSVASLKYLGLNPRSALVNMSSMATSVPAALHAYALEGKGGWAKVSREIARSMKDYLGVMTGKWGSFTADEKRFLEEVHKKSEDDPQFVRDALATYRDTAGKSWSWLMGKTLAMFGATERLNRGSTLLAGYRLARAAGADHDTAAARARETSDRAHGVYSKATQPAWTWGTSAGSRLGQSWYVYKKYGHNYLQLVHELFGKGDWQAATFALAAPMVLGGLSSQVAMSVVKGLYAAAGADDDPDKLVYDTIRKNLGGQAEDLARFGLLGLATGTDMSGSIGTMIDTPDTMTDVLGPMGGMARDVLAGIGFFAGGQPWRGAEKILPTGLSKPLQAWREAGEGVSTSKNFPVVGPDGKRLMPTVGESAAKALGFRPAREAAARARTSEAIEEEKKWSEKRDKIYSRFRAFALDGGTDAGERQDLVADVAQYNKAVAEAGLANRVSYITRESLLRQTERVAEPTKREKARLADGTAPVKPYVDVAGEDIEDLNHPFYKVRRAYTEARERYDALRQAGDLEGAVELRGEMRLPLLQRLVGSVNTVHEEMNKVRKGRLPADAKARRLEALREREKLAMDRAARIGTGMAVNQ
uniref:Rho termination factor-like N-terminal domain-containing protein n=1 Tax=Desulfovibrio sp. U5L TaxID=596152 RepID=I2Q1C9_9BACT